MSLSDRAESTARMKQARQEGFTNWLESPETKLMLSMIPQSDNPDAVKTILQSAFNAGCANGEGSILGEVVTAMLKGKKDDRGPF